MKYLFWMTSVTCLATLLISDATASISGKSLYMILNKGLVAAEAVSAKPTEVSELKELVHGLKTARRSTKAVPPETETAARAVLASLSTAYGDAYKAAFFKAFELPSPTEMQTQSYPRPGRVRMIAGFIAQLKTDKKFNDAYRNKVIEAADEKIGRPAEGETVTMYINKRKVSGPIRYHKNTFDIGIVTFPNEDLPSEYQLNLILTRKAEYVQLHFAERRAAYLKKGTDKVAASAMQSGKYVLLDKEWFSPTEARPALEYFLRPPENNSAKQLGPLEPASAVQRIKQGNNPTTLAIAHELLRYSADKPDTTAPNTMSPEVYSAFLTFWKDSQAARNNPNVSARLPISNESGPVLYAAALKLTVAMLMEP